MKQKLLAQLQAKTKDMGLTDKYVEQLANIGVNRLTDTSTETEIAQVADSLAEFGRATQAEITRKTRPQQQSKTQQSNNEGGENNEGTKANTNTPTAAEAAIEKLSKQYEKLAEQLTKMQTENEALKAAEQAASRQSHINAKAAELGIPDYLVKRISIPENADIDKELTEFKQELVGNNLVPKAAAPEAGSVLAASQSEAKAWAQRLPNR